MEEHHIKPIPKRRSGPSGFSKCFVRGCTVTSESKLSMHLFPKSPKSKDANQTSLKTYNDLLQKWILFCDRQKSPGPRAYVCELHFDGDAFRSRNRGKSENGRNVLLHYSYPTIKLSIKTPEDMNSSLLLDESKDIAPPQVSFSLGKQENESSAALRLLASSDPQLNHYNEMSKRNSSRGVKAQRYVESEGDDDIEEVENVEEEPEKETSSKRTKILHYDTAEEITFLKEKLDEERLKRRELEVEIENLKAERSEMCSKMNKLEASKTAPLVPSSLLPILSEAMSKGLDPARLAAARLKPASAANTPTKSTPSSTPTRTNNVIVMPGKTSAQKQGPASVLVQSVAGKPVVMGGQRYVIEHHVSNGQTVQMLVPLVESNSPGKTAAAPPKASRGRPRTKTATATAKAQKSAEKEAPAEADGAGPTKSTEAAPTKESDKNSDAPEATEKPAEESPKTTTADASEPAKEEGMISEEEEDLPLGVAASPANPVETPASPDPSDHETS